MAGWFFIFWGWMAVPASSRAQSAEGVQQPGDEKPVQRVDGGEQPGHEKPAPPPENSPGEAVPVPPAPELFPLAGTKLHVSRLIPAASFSARAAEARAEFVFARPAGAIDEMAKIAGTAGAPARLWKFLAAIRSLQIGEALGALQILRSDFPQLREWLVFQAARAHLAAGNLEEARALAQVVENGPYAAEGLQIQAETARRRQDFTAAEKILTRLAEMKLSRFQAAAVRLELARLMIRRKAPASAWKAHLAGVWSTVPQTQLARDAEETAVSAGLGQIAKWASCAQKIERARQLSDLQLHAEVVETLASAGPCSRDEKCEVLYWRGRSLSFLKKRRDAADALAAAVVQCEKTRNIELRVRSKYIAGRNARRTGDSKQALAYLRRVYREHPDDTYADDALYQEVSMLFEQGKAAAGLAKLQEMVRRYPRGDQAVQAVWRIVLEDLRAGKWAAAATALARAREKLAPEAPYEDWGRLLYWQGRCAHMQKDDAAARKFYAETVAMAPGTYHALWALHRMEELAAGEGTALLRRLLAASSPSVWPWSTLEHPDFAKPAFARILLFAQLGLPEEIPRELQELGRELPDRPESVPETDRPFWRAMMHAYLTAGETMTAARLQGRLLYDYAQGWPAGNVRKLWETAYPSGYAAEISAAAARFGVPAALLQGLVREESFFNASIRSPAGALGLGQLMPATARQMAAAAGVAVKTDADLLNPSVNLAITAAYLAKLIRHFDGNLLMAAGAYNAGENALARWRAQHAAQPLDLWVELLDVTETRNYIKRVLSSMFAYHMLAGNADFPRIETK